MTTTKIWECKIGEVDSVAGGSDYPMRQAVAAAYKAITGVEPVFIFSGWGASLTEYERAVVENRLPAPATAPSWQDAPTKPGMWACLYMGELSTAIFNAYEIEHFYASEMGGCRWQFIPDEDKP